MMRTIALLALALYPRTWRERYGAEVEDLLAARPARLRTVLDLVRGAGDAWFHTRPWTRVPSAAGLAPVLVLGTTALWLLWNPGVRDTSSLSRVWAGAAAHNGVVSLLPRVAAGLFVLAGAAALLALLLGALKAARTGSRTAARPSARTAAVRTVAVAGLTLAFPSALLGAAFYAQAFAHLGYPTGPLGDAMAGGFIVPGMLALALPPLAMAARHPALADAMRGSGRLLAAAGVLNALAWLPVLALMTLGMTGASVLFASAVTVGALLSVTLGGFVARYAAAQPEASPSRA